MACQEKTGADNVGGAWRILPGGNTPMARAIAVGLAHPFGVGNAYYRIGASAPRWVDTVPFGCYRREVFTRNGLFDEDHVRTEDDEFNLRLRKNGGRILLVPEIVIDYYARESLHQDLAHVLLLRLLQALVARKLGLVLSLRHLIPSLLVLSLGSISAFGLVVSRPGSAGISGPVSLSPGRPGLCLGGRARTRLAVSADLTLVFPTLHFSYGLGFLKGLLDFLFLGKKVSKIAKECRCPAERLIYRGLMQVGPGNQEGTGTEKSVYS